MSSSFWCYTFVSGLILVFCWSQRLASHLRDCFEVFGFLGFLNTHKNSTTCSTPLNNVQVPQTCCHHYTTPPGRLHTVQMQEFFLVEEHWHVFVVCVTRMHLDHYWHLYFMLQGADKVLGKVVPTLAEKVPPLLTVSFSPSSRLYGQSQLSPSFLQFTSWFLIVFLFWKMGGKPRVALCWGKNPPERRLGPVVTLQMSGLKQQHRVRPGDLASLLYCSFSFIKKKKIKPVRADGLVLMPLRTMILVHQSSVTLSCSPVVLGC